MYDITSYSFANRGQVEKRVQQKLNYILKNSKRIILVSEIEGGIEKIIEE